MDLELDSDWVLPTGWVGFQICEILWIWIWVRIGYCSRVGLDFKSVLSNGFGFGFGFSITLRLGWIMDLIYFSDLGLDLDSVLPSGWVGLWI